MNNLLEETETVKLQDPTTKYPAPPFEKQQEIPVPGEEKDLYPKADHGEESYRGTDKLKGRKAVVTGADSGIGKAVAIAFAREGADVVIAYLSDKEDEDARDTARWVEEAGRKAILFKGDLSKAENCQKLVATAVDGLGHIDLLVNNAAYQMAQEGIEDISNDQWDHTYATNIHSMFYLSKAAIPHMPPGSSIINTTSVNAYDPTPLLLDYASTKGAIQNFTSNLAQSLLQNGKGIRVNAVAPGPIWTPLIPSTMPNYKEFGDNTPMKRPGQPIEVSPIYVFLASEDASYIAGATIPVTGGRVTI
ncbi:SDR family oxidoreductase [Olivibacter sitiensis]|uniref:SDR family oxidoreductase n=1 Tax=Olivibacter sitiensis TaxID=376470 RepID=UPI0004280B0A|nr:SDR family oxidoreductase [Olivibacter sitiensis]